mgnify:CR=1 FL=1
MNTPAVFRVNVGLLDLYLAHVPWLLFSERWLEIDKTKIVMM